MDELEYNLDRVKFLWDRKKLKLLLEKLHIYQFLKIFYFLPLFIYIIILLFIRIHIPLTYTYTQNITYKILLNYKNIIQRSRYPEIVLTR